MKTKFVKIAVLGLLTSAVLMANLPTAGIIKVTEANFEAGAAEINFSEFSIGTVNSFYISAADPSVPVISVAAWFDG